ncbi:MAG TPA: DUF1566 domain-containing protein [Spirochaetota bacterium]|jgi:hypothetical protein|nr:DUF1566 domain-containing protein [Spirochaetota bacterium]HPJ16042.1 DUF1566 domain-containing protein [Spirochaetota bacterium]
MKNALFTLISIMLFISASRCSDTSFGNDLWDNVTSSKITSDKQITSFSINGYKARITGTTVKSVLPLGTSVTALAPVITHNGAAISPESGAAQNFTNPVTYTVTATDGTTEQYTVSVTVLDAAGMKNANLSVLRVKKGKLQPALNDSIKDYLDAPIPFSDSANPAYNDKQSNSLIADPEILIATITINGNPVENAEEYLISNLAVGPNKVEIMITSADESNVNIYKVNMYRAIPIFKTGAGEISGYDLNPLEDGATQRGVSWPNPRFKDNGNGTVTDIMTGLIWKTSEDKGTYNNAVNLSYNGTYRLPNLQEMRSLSNYSNKVNDYLSIAFSDYDKGKAYWTSTLDNTGDGYYFKMDSNVLSATSNSTHYYYWKIKGESKNLPTTGQTYTKFDGDDGKQQMGVVWPNPRFYTDESGAVVDNMTSLMWFQKSYSGSQYNYIGLDNYYKNNLNKSESSNYGFSDWTIPNVREIETLSNFGENDILWLKNLTGGLFDVRKEDLSRNIIKIWTSTINPADSDSAYCYDTDIQVTKIISKTASTCDIFPVRQAKIINY